LAMASLTAASVTSRTLSQSAMSLK
jgi:hypothetical protein